MRHKPARAIKVKAAPVGDRDGLEIPPRWRAAHAIRSSEMQSFNTPGDVPLQEVASPDLRIGQEAGQ